jgi:hypothetical protein
VDRVFLTGGSSRVPAVRRLFEWHMCGANTFCSDEAQLLVMHGEPTEGLDDELGALLVDELARDGTLALVPACFPERAEKPKPCESAT